MPQLREVLCGDRKNYEMYLRDVVLRRDLTEIAVLDVRPGLPFRIRLPPAIAVERFGSFVLVVALGFARENFLRNAAQRRLRACFFFGEDGRRAFESSRTKTRN